MNLYGFSQAVFKKLHIKALAVIIDDLKVFFFAISRLRHIFKGPLTYVVLKTVSSLMVKKWLMTVSNFELFMLFCTALILFLAKDVIGYDIFFSFTTLDLKLKHRFIKKFLSGGLEERPVKYK